MRQSELKQKLKKLESIPTLPSIAVKILTVSMDESSDLNTLCDIISKDQSLSVRVLKFANSAYYGTRYPVTTLQRAFSVLGMRMVRNLALSITVFDMFKKSSKSEILNDLWIHSIACAMLADRLARISNYSQPDEAFIAGLLHDVGKVVLFSQIPDVYEEIYLEAKNSAKDITEIELKSFGYTHSDVGKWAAERWNIPANLVESIWLHHQFSDKNGILESLPGIIQIADEVCVIHSIGIPTIASSSFFKTGPRSLEHISQITGLNYNDLESVVTEVLDQMEEVGELLGVQPDTLEMYVKATQSANQALGHINDELERTVGQLKKREKLLESIQNLNDRIHPSLTQAEAVEIMAEEVKNGLGLDMAICLAVNKTDCVLEGVMTEGNEYFPLELPMPSSFPESTDFELSPSDEKATFDEMEALLLKGSPEVKLHSRIKSALHSASLFSAPLYSKTGEILGEIFIDGSSVDDDIPNLQKRLEQFAYYAMAILERCILFEKIENQALELAHINQQAEETQKQLYHTERLASVGRLAAGAAHEINNPLAVISGKAQLLQRRIDDDSCRDSLATIIEQTERITKIINDLMGFARPADPELKEVKLPDLIDECLDLVGNRISLHEIEVRKDFPKKLSSVLVDPKQILQVLLNLVINAHHAMPEGGEIQFSAKENFNTNSIEVIIKDNGIGIPEKQLKNIFDPFFTTKEQGQGTGLGLAISHRIIENHGGAIKVESKEGAGTTFIISLPIDRGGQIKEIQSVLEKKRRKKQTAMKKPNRILVVDDEEYLREILGDSLKEEGYSIDTAEDGVEGLKKISAKTYDLVLLDIRMPRKDGLEVLHALKKSDPTLPVIIITGLASIDEIKDAIKSGAFSVLKKPFDIEELLGLVEKALAKRRKAGLSAG